MTDKKQLAISELIKHYRLVISKAADAIIDLAEHKEKITGINIRNTVVYNTFEILYKDIQLVLDCLIDRDTNTFKELPNDVLKVIELSANYIHAYCLNKIIIENTQFNPGSSIIFDNNCIVSMCQFMTKNLQKVCSLRNLQTQIVSATDVIDTIEGIDIEEVVTMVQMRHATLLEETETMETILRTAKHYISATDVITQMTTF